MSYTEIYIVKKNGDVELYAKIKNFHRGAMFVWIKLREFYNIQVAHLFDFKKTWELYYNGKLEEFENITLGTTFDNVIVSKRDLLNVASAFEKFYEKYQGSSLKEQATVLKKIHREEEDCLGCCWNQTSVNGDTWSYYPDCEHEEERLFNTNKDENNGKHWFLFDKENEGKLSQ